MPTPPINPRTKAPIKERIGVYGPPGAGKTHQLFVIAKWHQDLGSDAKFYGICTDGSYEVLSMNEEFEGLRNIEWTDVQDFDDYVQAAKRYHRVLRAQDWLSVDLQNAAWAAAQDEYASVKAGGKLDDMGDLWLEKGSGDKYPIEGWDWGMPNARYRVFTNNYLVPGNGHRFMVYGQKELMKESGSGKSDEDPKTKAMFKHIGLKPEGQKDDPFRWHTLLHLDSGRDEKTQVMSTAKERWGKRRWWGIKMTNGQVRDEPMKDFFMEYLVGTAGWSME